MGDQLTEGAPMVWEIVAGIIVLGLIATAFWYFLPREGQTHPWVTLPFFESLIPLALLSGLALGGALLLAGILAG
jgi:hypothetical protein